MSRFFLSCFFCLFLGMALPLSAQDFSNRGKDFWVGYGYHNVMNNGNVQEMVLYFATDQVTTVTVEIPLLGYRQTYSNIAANTIFTSNPLPKSGPDDARLLVSGISKAGIHITSDKPIVAYAHIYNQNVSGATLLFPTPTLGKEYYSVNYEQTSNAANSNSWVYAIAVDTGVTTVEIVPSGPTENNPLGQPYTVELGQGQVVNVMGALTNNASFPFTGVDLTGTKVRSISSAGNRCKRLAVFSGSGRISVSCSGGANSSDNYIAQAFPKNAWGKKYLTVPTKTMDFNFYRICVIDPATKVTMNGTTLTGLVGNFYYQSSTDKPSVIESDQPIMVAQVVTSQNECSNGPVGDPEVIYLSPVEQNINKVILNSTSNFSIAQHWINVVIKNSDVASFKLDGTNASGAFQPHPQDPAYMYAQINAGAGQHILEADSGFNAIAYGFGNFESYGYNAGTNIKDLYQFISIQNELATVNYPASCSGSPFFLSMTFPYQPTQIEWKFNGLFPDVVLNNPVADSTWFVNGKQLFRYRLPTTYSSTNVGTFPIKVIAQNPSSDGCGNEQEINYDLQIFPQPLASFDFTTNGCVSDSVRFKDLSNTGGRPIFTWQWNFGDGSTGSSDQNPAHLYPVTGSYPAKLKVVTDIGCVSNEAQQTVNLSQSPEARFSVTGAQCAGGTLTFTNESISPASPITKWYWNFGDGSPLVTAVSGEPQTHTYASANTYSVTLVVETASGCKSGTATKVISVEAAPVPSFTIGSACLPDAAIQFTNTSTLNGVSGNLTYLWNFGDGTTSTAKDPLHTYTSVGPFTVVLQASTTGGCTASKEASVTTIAPQPLAAFAVNTAAVCLGSNLVTSDQSSISAGSITQWTWDFGDGSALVTAPSGVAQTHLYPAPGNYTITLLVQSAAGCSSAPVTIPVSVLALPVPRFEASALRCAGSQMVFTSTSVPNSGTITQYEWFVNGNSTATGASFTFVPPAAGPYTIRLAVATDKGCISSGSDSVVQVNPLPEVKFGMPENCVEDPISRFTDSSTVPNGSVVSWLWNFGDGNATPANPNTSTLQNGMHKFSQARDYNVSLAVTSDKSCVASATQLFTINGSLPQSSFTLASASPACVSSEVVITSSPRIDVGRIVKTEIFWDDLADGGNKTVDEEPELGETYRKTYQPFFSPASRTFTIRVRSYSGEQCFDDSVIQITLNAVPQIAFAIQEKACASDVAFQLNAVVANVPGTGTYSGKGVSASGLFNPSSAGEGVHIIRYTFTSTEGCVAFREDTVIVSPVPAVVAGPLAGLGVLEGGSVTIPATASGPGLTYVWTPPTWLSNATVLRPVASPLRDTIYSLTVTTSQGCSAVSQVSVKVLKGITVPNVFTPNGDGINDRWEITYLESYAGAIIQLYNRNGQMIFQSKGYNKPWDGTINGKPVPFGTYYYVIDPKNGRKPLTGFVDVLR